MDTIEFPEVVLTIAKDQPQYRPIPAYFYQAEPGRLVFCWKLNEIERAEVNRTGVIWHIVQTGGRGLQPQMLLASKPEMPAHIELPPTLEEVEAAFTLPEPGSHVERLERHIVAAATIYGASVATGRSAMNGGEIPDDIAPDVAQLLIAAYLSGMKQTAHFLGANEGAEGINPHNVLAAARFAGERLGFVAGNITPPQG